MKIALAGIVKNELPYLLEWISHHINIGIDHFIIANHGSTDGTTELLEAFQKLGLVTTFFIPAETEAPQLNAYKDIIENYGSNYEWIGFLDIDEFFTPEKGISIKKILSNQKDIIGGIIFYWANYGSSFQKVPDHFELPSPVTARFNWRAHKNFEPNKFTKCFVKPYAVDLNLIVDRNDPHAIPLLDKYKFSNSAGETINHHPIQSTNIITWKNARINHYTIKSGWEFAHSKIPKGRVDRPKGIHRNWLFFHLKDINEIFEPMYFYLQEQRDDQIDHLKVKLKSVCYEYPNRKSKLVEYKKFDYDIQSIIIKKHQLILSGWMVDPNGKSYASEIDIFIKQGETKIFPSEFKLTKNNTVKKKYPYSSLRSGLNICFPIDNLKKGNIVSLIIDYGNKKEKILEINLDDLRNNRNHSIFSKIINRLFLNR